MRTTLNIADDVYAVARAIAQGSGRSLGAVLSELARRGLRPRQEKTEADGFPVFDVPPDAEIIPGDRASALLAEEGLD